ncbi:trimeric porin PorB [Neisseria bacilliformis]|uniref:trimeric porin PorB n=1 Tax=Neisseria bacilliformis TaxID=267212 RepID=UPI0028E468C0|nr:trimeric porin PorB [Neisseria bacilliformis]
MKKTLIALSLFGLSTAAMADVTLYGQIKAGVEVSQTKIHENGVKIKDHTTTELADFGSRIGFKGHESLGNGLNAIWKVESRTPVSGTGNAWGNRQAYIGLETTAGTIRAGKMSTQLDDMEDGSGKWENNNHALDLDTLKRTSEKILSVRYDSPVFAGFSGNVQFSPRDNETTNVRGVGYTNGRDGNGGDTSSYYAGLNYENSGFFAQYGFAYKKTASVGTSGKKSGQAHRVVAGYDANNLFVSGTYQYTNGWDSVNSYAATLLADEDYDATADHSAGIKTHELAVSGAYTMGNVTPKVSYAHGFKVKGKNLSNELKDASEYNQVVIGADYDFSKRTTAFAQAGWLKAGKKDNKVETTAGLVGLRHKF